MRWLRSCSLATGFLALVMTGCGPPAKDKVPIQKPDLGGSAAKKAREAFENPGGMWTPAQLRQHADTLERLGLELDPSALSDPTAYPLGAVVWLGGCTASFVSPDGLIITNHHCAIGALQFNSTKDANLLESGYLARSRADEKSNGPAAHVYVTQKFTDVTQKVRAGLVQETDDKARYKLAEQHTKELIAACERNRPEIRCSVVSYYGGEQYVLIEQLDIRDVRLVYAPAAGIGNYGGEVDNWQWPRHTGDFAFFRAYVGPDDKPADHNKNNVPYKPKQHLEIASDHLKTSDLVMVAGYPGNTTRLVTSKVVAEAVDWYYPRRFQFCEDYITMLERIGEKDKTLAIKADRLRRGLSNLRTNVSGMVDGLVKGGLKDTKTSQEKELHAWLEAHPDHWMASKAIARLGQHYDKYRGQRDKDAALQEAVYMSMLLSAADKIVRMAEERPKPNSERHPDFQERNHKRMAQRQQHLQRTYARVIDKEKLKLALVRAARLPREKQPAILSMIAGCTPTESAIEGALAPMYAATKLEDAAVRVELLQTASTDDLKASTDPFIRLALRLRPLLQAVEDREDGYSGAKLIDLPPFMAALRASKGGVVAPDANRTLRVTYGTVRGYKPRPDAPLYFPFSNLDDMIGKHRGKPPFNAPKALLDTAKRGEFGKYVNPQTRQISVDFLSDLDITGGNSGSPTLNAKGELVGLAFDGNYEAMASDWLFMPDITRSIHVDIRYVLWIMQHVDKAHHLLAEMGVTK